MNTAELSLFQLESDVLEADIDMGSKGDPGYVQAKQEDLVSHLCNEDLV